MRGDKPRVIATWQSLGDYLEDVKEVFPTLPVGHRHASPAIQALLLPNPKITEKLERFRTQLDSTEFVKSTKLFNDTSGEAIDMGLYLSGVPECFIRSEKIHGSDVRLVFSPEVHVTSNPDALYLRGAAVLSIIDSLESQGNRVELWMGWDNTVGNRIYESRILVKKASDYATAQQLAGVSCDSRFLSTCEFNMIAHFLNTSNVGYNAGLSLKGDITIDGSYDSMSDFDSLEACIAWIEKMKGTLVRQNGETK